MPKPRRQFHSEPGIPAIAMHRLSLNFFRIFAALLLTLVVVSAVTAAPKFPKLTDRVVDIAGMLPDQTAREIRTRLAAHEKETGNQVVVVTIRSLEGYSIEEYGYLLGRHWGIGQKNRDNGVLLIVAKADRKLRIEVGYGLEGVLTDALSKQVIESVILPSFKAGYFVRGIERGVEAILAITAGKTWEPPEPEFDWNKFGGFAALAVIMLFVFSMLFFSVVDGRPENGGSSHNRYRDPSVSPSRFGSSGGFGGGFGGGGGGLSGGGGGFGGGGASGGW